MYVRTYSMHIIFHVYHYSYLNIEILALNFTLFWKQLSCVLLKINLYSKIPIIPNNFIWKENSLNWWLVKWYLLNSYFSSSLINKAHIWHCTLQTIEMIKRTLITFSKVCFFMDGFSRYNLWSKQNKTKQNEMNKYLEST